MVAEDILQEELNHVPCGRNSIIWVKSAIIVRRLTTTRITMCPWEHGSSTIKSIDIVDEGCGGVGRSWRRPSVHDHGFLI